MSTHKKDARAAYRVETKSLVQLAKDYPRDDAEDHGASMEAYLLDMHSQGWEFIQSISDGYGYRYFFKAV